MQAVATGFRTAYPLRRTFPWGQWAEFTLGFVVLPIVVGFAVPPPLWVPCLWIVAGAAWLKMRSEGYQARSSFWKKLDSVTEVPEMRRIAKRFVICAAAMTAVLMLWRPDHLFDFPRRDPWLWLAIVVLYPVISVYPQELLYRRYFFQRFAGLFRTRTQRALASALVFSWMHLMFRNEAALVMTFIGGWFFADTFRRSRSLRLACIEHALYGNLVFTIGFGEFIYHGAVRL